MSEVRLGEADAGVRWIGIRPHQALCAVVGVGLAGQALLAARVSVAVVVVGVAVALGAVPSGPGTTFAEAGVLAVAFALRRRWTSVGALELDRDVLVWAGGSIAVTPFERVHRGRLDLAGRDLDDARALGAALDAASAGGDGRVTLHVVSSGPVRTLCATTLGLRPPEGWVGARDTAGAVTGSSERTEVGVLERPSYVRTEVDVRRVFRVRDFRAVAPGAALLERTLRTEAAMELVVRLELVDAARAGRLAARAAHRVGSDAAASGALGFRRTARSARHLARLAQHEVEVAGGRALVRLAVYLVVPGRDLAELDERSGALWRHAHECGLRLERGRGRQAHWHRATRLGGGPPARQGLFRAWTHWATTRDLVDLRLPAHDAGSGLGGEPVGRALFGGPFVLDPVDAYRAGLVTNPNVVVAGAIGAGKSTVVKMLVERALRRGRRAVVVDPKGEYGDLARAHGVAPVVLGRDGWCDPVGEQGGRDLVRALLASAQGAALSDEQHYALDQLWAGLAAGRPTRPLRALYERVEGALASDRPSATRSIALALHRFVAGDLAGLFDGEGPPLGLEAPLVVVDLSAQWSSTTMPVAALSVVAAAQRAVGDARSTGYLVLDEAWALLGEPEALRWLRGSWKLARARGLSHVLVVHRWGDAGAVGDAGSAQVERARGLLRECETAWLFRQPPDEAAEMREALALSEALEVRYLTAVPRGTAVVRYGPFRSVVAVGPDARDRTFVATDAAMRRGA